MSTSKTVFVGMSGGVDSSVAALRLKKQGFTVVGVFIKVWHPDFLECNWEAERLDAMRVAAHLEIPFLTCNAEAAYKADVADYFIAAYKAGRTPNPDVMCNQHVKFGAFLAFAKQHGADFIATGHYVIRDVHEGCTVLNRGLDKGKDQSYFLWTLTQEQLAQSLFPVGDTPKEIIRLEAEAADIPVADKKDSQGVCFLGHIDIPDFLSHFIDLVPGVVLDEAGQTIGRHKGALVYTIGQRHGFTIKTNEAATSAHYVVDRNLTTNTITVSSAPKSTVSDQIVELTDCNWFIAAPKAGGQFLAQFRYRQKPFLVQVISANETSMKLSLPQATELTAVGQSCVLYTTPENTRCVGGGIIS